MSRGKPYRGLADWNQIGNEALDRWAGGLVRVAHPSQNTWTVEYGATRRHHQTVVCEDRRVLCTCADFRKGRPCWHIALICHQSVIQVPYFDPHFRRGV